MKKRNNKEKGEDDMGAAGIIKSGIVVVGIIITLASFWFHSIKRLTVNFAVAWEFLGLILIVIGTIPAMKAWIRMISAETGLVLLVLGMVCLMGGFQFSLLISQLTMKTQELAIQVSLLNQENERMMYELEEIHSEKDGNDFGREKMR